MFAKGKKSAFTMVELLIVVGIIAILVALLIPAVSAVKNMAKATQQRAQLTTIEMALTAFKNDYGDYPPSSWLAPDYCGAQKLSEALVGWDLMGFHPKSAWRADGEGQNRRDETYDPDKTRDNNPPDGTPDTLKERKGPYLELATSNAFQLGQLFKNTAPLDPNTYVICDVFGKKVVTIGTTTVKAGAPILYYRANTSSKTIETVPTPERIYNPLDNRVLIYVKEQDDGKQHPLENPSGTYSFFYEYIRDPKVTATKWPYRPDSYILISAGADGLYGTNDDIHNF
jgi:prepilin-type N-terminal cleavage/methylation domain-containing protein